MRTHCKEVSARRVLPAKAEGVVLPCWADLKQIVRVWWFTTHFGWHGDS